MIERDVSADFSAFVGLESALHASFRADHGLMWCYPRSQGIEKMAVKPADAFWGYISGLRGMPDELGVRDELTEPIILIAILKFEGRTYLYDITRSGLDGDRDFSSSDAAEQYAEEEYGPGVQWQIPPEDKTLRQILDEIPKDSFE